MQYAEFVSLLAKEESLSKTDSTAIVKMVFETLGNVLKSGESVTLYNFGKFTVKTTKERVGRNVRTGESIQIPAHKKVAFKPSNSLKLAIRKG